MLKRGENGTKAFTFKQMQLIRINVVFHYLQVELRIEKIGIFLMSSLLVRVKGRS